MSSDWPEGLLLPDSDEQDALWVRSALDWLAAQAPPYLAGHQELLAAAPGALAEIVSTALEDRLEAARRAYARLAGHLADQGLEPQAVASAPVIQAVVAEGRHLAVLAREVKAVAAAVLEHGLFAAKPGLKRRIVTDEQGREGGPQP